MQAKAGASVKYRIKSFGYDNVIEQRLVFTLEEPGACGETRQFADEILSACNLAQDFSIIDAAIILHVAETEPHMEEASLPYVISHVSGG